MASGSRGAERSGHARRLHCLSHLDAGESLIQSPDLLLFIGLTNCLQESLYSLVLTIGTQLGHTKLDGWSRVLAATVILLVGVTS